MPAATAAASAGKTSQGGEVWPPGQPADCKSGRLVFNANVHGTVFNTAAGKLTLTKFMDTLRSNPAAVFPPRAFGAMALDPGYGLRLVNEPGYPCACEGASLGGGWTEDRRFWGGAQRCEQPCGVTRCASTCRLHLG